MLPEESKLSLDEVAAFNQARWDDLAQAGVRYSLPALDLDEPTAKNMVDREDVLGSVSGRRVLCLAAGGGQQSAAFGILGADVTVLDISEVQLERDASTAKQYGYLARLEHGDMRDLSRFSDASFDIVWQAHSINFIPRVQPVFSEVSRVLTVKGLYRLQFTNPFIHGTWERSWTGSGYLLAGPYLDEEVSSEEPWTIQDVEGNQRQVKGPREFRHTLGTLLNGMIAQRLRVLGLWEDSEGEATAPPGSWKHFKRFGAPWITVVAQKSD